MTLGEAREKPILHQAAPIRAGKPPTSAADVFCRERFIFRPGLPVTELQEKAWHAQVSQS